MTDEAAWATCKIDACQRHRECVHIFCRNMTPEPAQPAESPEARVIAEAVNSMIVDMPPFHGCTLGKFMDSTWINDEWPALLAQASTVAAKAMLAATTARPTERGAVEALRAALEPVMHWYQSDEHEARPLPDIVADIVADLQTDRGAALKLAALTPPVTVAATDQAGEVERLRADMYTMIFFSNMPMAARLLLNRAYHALDTKPATGRTMGGEERKWKAALQDIAEAEAIPNDAVAFVWCRDVARAALQNGVE